MHYSAAFVCLQKDFSGDLISLALSHSGLDDLDDLGAEEPAPQPIQQPVPQIIQQPVQQVIRPQTLRHVQMVSGAGRGTVVQLRAAAPGTMPGTVPGTVRTLAPGTVRAVSTVAAAGGNMQRVIVRAPGTASPAGTTQRLIVSQGGMNGPRFIRTTTGGAIPGNGQIRMVKVLKQGTGQVITGTPGIQVQARAGSPQTTLVRTLQQPGTPTTIQIARPQLQAGTPTVIRTMVPQTSPPQIIRTVQPRTPQQVVRTVVQQSPQITAFTPKTTVIRTVATTPQQTFRNATTIRLPQQLGTVSTAGGTKQIITTTPATIRQQQQQPRVIGVTPQQSQIIAHTIGNNGQIQVRVNQSAPNQTGTTTVTATQQLMQQAQRAAVQVSV